MDNLNDGKGNRLHINNDSPQKAWNSEEMKLMRLKKEKHLGLWNANLDFIRDQLPSLEDELEIVKEYINAGKISDFHCNGLFSPQSVKWEA